MTNHNEIQTNAEIAPAMENNEEQIRKPYCKPLLEDLGDLRALTLGGSPGCGDSGANIGIQAPWGGGSIC
ncbi:MAG: lasso RiPP family leader peptide-containing protein [Anaerolineales bacterium]|nr:lasso RiPP family leader peptide-containing protein [Anaerolineales bacterium]